MSQDILERMNNRASDVLDNGERYFGAQPMTIKGRSSLAAWAEQADVEGSLPNYVAAHGVVDELSVADDTIPNAFLAAVTEQRVLVFSRSLTGKPKELVETYELGGCTLDVIDQGDRARSRIFVFGTPSGEVFAGECAINGKAQTAADAFVDAWSEAVSMN